MRDDRFDTVTRDANEDERKTKEEDQGQLAFEVHVRSHDNRDRKDDEDEIGDDVGRAHGEELNGTLTALRARVGYHLPVVVIRLTLGLSGDDNSNEGDEEEPTDDLEADLIGSPP